MQMHTSISQLQRHAVQIPSSKPVGRLRSVRGLLDWLRSRHAQLKRRRRKLHDYDTLLSMPEHRLRDLGLSVAQVREARLRELERPLGCDHP
ncbi:MAG: hypothetical protein AAF409_04745 [Pseudomonadota bacterium]